MNLGVLPARFKVCSYLQFHAHPPTLIASGLVVPGEPQAGCPGGLELGSPGWVPGGLQRAVWMLGAEVQDPRRAPSTYSPAVCVSGARSRAVACLAPQPRGFPGGYPQSPSFSLGVGTAHLPVYREQYEAQRAAQVWGIRRGCEDGEDPQATTLTLLMIP